MRFAQNVRPMIWLAYEFMGFLRLQYYSLTFFPDNTVRIKWNHLFCANFDKKTME